MIELYMASYVVVILSCRATKDLVEQKNMLFFPPWYIFAFLTPCSLKYESFIHTLVHLNRRPLMVWCSLHLLSYSFRAANGKSMAYSIIPVITSPSTLELDATFCSAKVEGGLFLQASRWDPANLALTTVWLDNILLPSQQLMKDNLTGFKNATRVGINWQFDRQPVSLQQWLALSIVSVLKPQTGI